ncbi:MAG: hypothetical protein DRI01_00580 [Chloroflexi bacterium]|nr:MAG: hypothetical protein DRI01_00580 [Chloroflexota bacterium]
MSFTYDPSTDTDRNRLRNLLADTDSSNYLFTDEELDLFLAQSGNDVFWAASFACLAIAANKSLQAIVFNLHQQDIRVDKKDIPKHFIKLAELYRDFGSSMTVREYFDSVAEDIDEYGRDLGEYVGDSELS